MRAILTFSAVHKRQLVFQTTVPSETEAFYAQQSLIAFQDGLSSVCEKKGGALLATATLINGTAFAMTEADDYRMSWPYRSSAGNDLQWLKVQGGE